MIEQAEKEAFTAEYMIYVEDTFQKSERDDVKIVVEELLPDRLGIALKFQNPLDVSQGDELDYMLIKLSLKEMTDEAMQLRYDLDEN